jgi:DNA invertase Pin-like site-specific DNA recombinase
MKKNKSAELKVVGYIRVSTDQQADAGHSLEAQRAKLEAYAITYDLAIVAFEIDAGLSAATLERPGLQRALARVEFGQVDGIIVTRLDRLTRSVRDFAELVHRFFRGGQARLMSVNEQIDTATPTGRLILNVLMSVSEWEREATIERTRTVMTRMKERGEYTGGHPPFGWAVGEDGVLVEHLREQELRVAARKRRADGWSFRTIARSYTNPRTGRNFNEKQIRRMCYEGAS